MSYCVCRRKLKIRMQSAKLQIKIQKRVIYLAYFDVDILDLLRFCGTVLDGMGGVGSYRGGVGIDVVLSGEFLVFAVRRPLVES